MDERMGERNRRATEILARLMAPDIGEAYHVLYRELEECIGIHVAESMVRRARENRDKAVKEAEDRRLQAEALAAVLRRPPAPRQPKVTAPLSAHIAAIKEALKDGPRARDDVWNWVKENLPGKARKLFLAAWQKTPSELKIQRGKRAPKPSA
jgi:hypothetical protein